MARAALPPAPAGRTLDEVERAVVACRRCPRLVAFREQAAAHPKPAFAGETYWARPVPGFGDPEAGVYVLGLATAAHGGNRTGRAFTGNATADWLVAALHRAGLATQPTSRHRADGLRLTGAWMASAVRCAPPGDRPAPQERRACASHLDAELALLTRVRVLVCLGALAWTAAADWAGVRPRPAFAHGAEQPTGRGLTLLATYHPSPQNTRTGRLTPAMLDTVLTRAVTLAAG
ncbi:uracil-DNA glycosylase [Actinoplanes sp. N902-109]|uniref:uracil-DNA glycosylase n=1 Tax=Actinoplanes sp. (strain N902-109) TaxID=649831 RepID=UPI0003294DDF|nr:uracil-DNA glycosylase [Actinoplanes sp. N902-109]AGL18950.1 uracil-DNA glycosylase superfamily protein [Actinoplanes sp. N902-109]